MGRKPMIIYQYGLILKMVLKFGNLEYKV